ncbi:MAG: hypothetical protein Q7T82_12560 [Armatimonadota bacterium]|nr:hypothetical protein [Armatimonadota bacterium]
MKTVCIELNDKLAESLSAVIREGLFKTDEEAIRFALIAFIEKQKPALIEQFQKEDIMWALDQKRSRQ